METTPFRCVGILAKDEPIAVPKVVAEVLSTLTESGCRVLSSGVASDFAKSAQRVHSSRSLADQTDLVVVVGGDGSLLAAARELDWSHVPLLGINLGRLGFLADLSPLQVKAELPKVLRGHYETEHRMLLQARIEGSQNSSLMALNDVVLKRLDGVRLLELELMIGSNPLGRIRADGLIVASPTGSTAYALSAGGPIIHPDLRALSVVPICPHSLGERPIVVGADQTIHVRPLLSTKERAEVVLDGQLRFELTADQTLAVGSSSRNLLLLHPSGYGYFANLRKKLGWGWRTPTC